MNTKFLLFLGCAVVLMAVTRGSGNEGEKSDAEYKQEAEGYAQNASDTAAAAASAAGYANGNDTDVQKAQQAVQKKVDELETGNPNKGAAVTKAKSAKSAAEASETASNKATSELSILNNEKGKADAAVSNIQGKIDNTAGFEAILPKTEVSNARQAAEDVQEYKSSIVKQLEIVLAKKTEVDRLNTEIDGLIGQDDKSSSSGASTAGKNISKSDGTTASNNASVINSGPTSSDSSFNTTPAANSSTNVTDDGNSDRGNYGGEAVTANKWLMLCSTAALFALANFAF